MQSWPGDAEHPDLVMITKSVGQRGPAGRDMERQLSPVASHHNSDPHIRIEPHDLLDFFETLNRASVDAKDDIAWLEAALFRRTPRLHLTDFGRGKKAGHSYLWCSSVAAG
jgi:hypothetical protein